MENNKRLSLIVGVLAVVVISVSFGYFFSQIIFQGEGAETTLETADIKDTVLKTEGVLSFDDLDIYPGHQNVSSIRVTATGDQNILYNVLWTGTNSLATPLNYYVYKSTSEENPVVTCNKVVENGEVTVHYYETCVKSGFGNLGEVVSSGTIKTSLEETTFKLIRNEELQATEDGNVVYYYVILEFPNLDEDQNIDIDGSLDGEVKTQLLFEKDTPRNIKDMLATKNVLKVESFDNVLTEDTTGSVFTAEDNDGTSYYFAGAPTDNYVKFAGKYWRMVRVNGDGSLRLIYSGESADASGDSLYALTEIAYNNINSLENAYVGYMYTVGSVHGLGSSSNLKNELDKWYDDNLASYETNIDMDAGFCNDREPYLDEAGENSGGGTSITNTYYGAYIRLVTNQIPSLKCTNSLDLFTHSTSIKGNNSLTKPIGTITVDELVYAGARYGIANDDYYLYTGSNFWTMSPASYYVASNMFYGRDDGFISWASSDATYGIRPVINLKANIEFVPGGDGTSTTPFEVV